MLLILAAASGSPTLQPQGRVASADGQAVVRILTPALIGAEFGPPRSGMNARDALVAQPGGGMVAIKLYEFE